MSKGMFPCIYEYIWYVSIHEINGHLFSPLYYTQSMCDITRRHIHTLHTLRHVGLRKGNEGKSDRTPLLSQIEASYKGSESRSVMSYSLRSHGLYNPWNSPGQDTEVGSCSLPQGFSQPRDRTQVSHIAGGFFSS